MKNFSLYKAIAIFSVIVCVTMPHLAHADITSNLLLNYTLDDNAGNATVVDSKGTSNGTASANTSTLHIPGRFGTGAFAFASTSSQYIETNYTWSSSDPNLTIAAWVKSDLVTDNEEIVGSYNGQNAYIQMLITFQGYLACGMRDSAGNSLDAALLVKVPFDGAWHHVACVVSGTTITSYLDDAVAGTGSNGSVNGDYRGSLPRTMLIGQSGNNSAYFGGNMDDLRIYNRALTASDIDELVGVDADLFGWWKFDEGSGTTAADSSGSGNTGTLSGSVVPTWAVGKIGPYALNNTVGVGGPGGYVLTANTTSGFHQDVTYSAWVYPTDLTGESSSNTILTGNGWGQFYIDSSGHLSFVDRVGGFHIYSGASIPLNAWTQVALTCHDTFGAGSDAVTLYINGSQVMQDVGSNFCYDNFTNNYFLATYSGIPGHYGWTGYLDDVRVYYGRALTSSDVAALYALGSPPPAPPPAIFHSFVSKVGRLFTIKLGKRFQIQ